MRESIAVEGSVGAVVVCFLRSCRETGKSIIVKFSEVLGKSFAVFEQCVWSGRVVRGCKGVMGIINHYYRNEVDPASCQAPWVRKPD